MRRRKEKHPREDVELSIPEYIDSQLGSIERFRNSVSGAQSTTEPLQEPIPLPSVYYVNEGTPNILLQEFLSDQPSLASRRTDPRFPLLNTVTSFNSNTGQYSPANHQQAPQNAEVSNRPDSCPASFIRSEPPPTTSRQPSTHHGSKFFTTFSNYSSRIPSVQAAREPSPTGHVNEAFTLDEGPISLSSPQIAPILSVPSSPDASHCTSPVLSPESAPSFLNRSESTTPDSCHSSPVLHLPSPPSFPLSPPPSNTAIQSPHSTSGNSNGRDQKHPHGQGSSVSTENGSYESDHSPEEYIVIEIPENTAQTSGIPRYVQAFFIYMYITGQSSFIQNGSRREEMTIYGRIMYNVQKAFFWIATIFGIYYSYAFSKNNLFVFPAYRQFDDFVRCGFYGCCFVIQIYFAHLVAFRQQEVSSMLQKWEGYELYTCGRQESTKRWNTALAIVITYGIFSQILSLSKSIWRMGIQDWSYEGMMLYYSQEIVNGFMYRLTQEGIKAALNETKLTYGTSLTPFNHFLGWIGFLSNLFYNVRTDAVRDLFIFVSLTNKDQVWEHIWRAKDQLALRQAYPSEQTVEGDVHAWSIYRVLLDVIGDTNDVLGGLLNLLHVYNLVTLSFVLEQCLDNHSDPISQVSLGTNLAKALVVYVVARKTACMNSTCQEWIEGIACKTKRFFIGRTVISKLTMLAELARRPLGLGSPLIDDGFLFNSMGLVLSLFGVLVGISLSYKEDE